MCDTSYFVILWLQIDLEDSVTDSNCTNTYTIKKQKTNGTHQLKSFQLTNSDLLKDDKILES